MNRHKQTGVAIILAIMITALAAAMAATLVMRVQQWIDRVGLVQDYTQARELARSGIDYAIAVLQDDALNNSVDHLGEDWARKLPPFEGEGGVIALNIDDLQGKFNLNNLLVRGKINEKAFKLYSRLLTQLNLPIDLADSLADWLDQDDVVRGKGAEKSYYSGLQPKVNIANSHLLNLSTLERIKGYTPEVIKKLDPFVTVFPFIPINNQPKPGSLNVEQENAFSEAELQAQPKINPNTASAEILQAAIEGLSMGDAQSIVQARKKTYFRDNGEFVQRLPNTELKYLTAFDTQTRYFLIKSASKYGDAQVNMKCTVYRSSNTNERGWARIVSLNLE